MSFVDRMLDPPGYGYSRDGKLFVPPRSRLWREFFSRLNPLRLHNWINIVGVTVNVAFVAVFFDFLIFHFSWPLLAVCYVYSMFVMGSHANFWIHRYCTHRAFKFRNAFVRSLCRNLVIKMVAEEIHVISHHVHHHIPEKPGDPYNTNAGFLYCFLGDVNHQGIRKDLSEPDYLRLRRLMDDSGIRLNSYAQYKRWGTICHPIFTLGHYLLNWSFWFAAFFAIGGASLAIALFGSAGVWALAYRTFNFYAHGGGRDLRKDGVDFNRDDLSINNFYSGTLTGEWHNNHHLYPRSARAGFLPGQLDLPWMFTRFLYSVGAVTSFRDDKAEFIETHIEPRRLEKTGS